MILLRLILPTKMKSKIKIGTVLRGGKTVVVLEITKFFVTVMYLKPPYIIITMDWDKLNDCTVIANGKTAAQRTGSTRE